MIRVDQSEDYTPTQAADPSTPGEVLAAIAGSRPDLRPYLAANPATYPALLEWLGNLGDPAVDGALRARSLVQEPPEPPESLREPDHAGADAGPEPEDQAAEPPATDVPPGDGVPERRGDSAGQGGAYLPPAAATGAGSGFGGGFAQPGGAAAPSGGAPSQSGSPYPQPGGEPGQAGSPYAQPGGPPAQPESPYAAPGGAYPQPSSPYAQPGGAHGQPGSPYPQQGGASGQPESPYAQPGGPYAQPGSPYAQPGGPHAQPGAYGGPGGPGHKPSRAWLWILLGVVGLMVIGGTVAIVVGLVTAVNRVGGAEQGIVQTYGDDPALDALWDSCAGGDLAACDELYRQSPRGSEYETFGDTCGRRTDGGLWCDQ